MIELKHIDKYYNIGTVNEVCLFKDFNLTVDDGDFISVIGSNGSGKTSMLNLICGSLEAEAGNIILNGEDISHQKEYIRQRKIGRVYQNPAMGTCPSMKICLLQTIKERNLDLDLVQIRRELTITENY